MVSGVSLIWGSEAPVVELPLLNRRGTAESVGGNIWFMEVVEVQCVVCGVCLCMCVLLISEAFVSTHAVVPHVDLLTKWFFSFSFSLPMVINVFLPQTVRTTALSAGPRGGRTAAVQARPRTCYLGPTHSSAASAPEERGLWSSSICG